jgi:hypothetical protein
MKRYGNLWTELTRYPLVAIGTDLGGWMKQQRAIG